MLRWRGPQANMLTLGRLEACPDPAITQSMLRDYVKVESQNLSSLMCEKLKSETLLTQMSCKIDIRHSSRQTNKYASSDQTAETQTSQHQYVLQDCDKILKRQVNI